MSEIKSPVGMVFQKYMYVYTCFIIKMSINFRSFGLFGSIWFGDNAPGRISGTLNFGVLLVKKFKFRKAENMGYECRNGSVSEKVQKFGERSILMKCSLLYGGFSSNI